MSDQKPVVQEPDKLLATNTTRKLYKTLSLVVSSICIILLTLLVYTYFTTKKALKESNLQVEKYKHIIDKAEASKQFYKQKLKQDSVIQAYAQQKIDSIQLSYNQLKKQASKYESLLSKKPTDPVSIIDLDSAEIFLSERYFPKE